MGLHFHRLFTLYFKSLKAPKLKQSPEAIVLGLVSGLVGIYLILRWRFDNDVQGLIYAATAIGLISAVSQRVASVIAQGWMFLGMAMGKVVGSVLLTIVYFLFLTPISVLQKVFSGKGKFKMKAPNAGSTWIDREHNFKKDDLKELW